MQNKSGHIIIHGKTHTGHTFRPSDWAEMLCENLCSFHNGRMSYSPLLLPGCIDSEHCVFLDPTLEQENPNMFLAVMHFAKSNNLVIEDDR